MTAQEIIAKLGLQPHPEGGWFGETFRDVVQTDGRAASTAIYYLLEAGDRSHWHRVDAVEIWHFYAGAPLQLSVSDQATKHFTLGADVLLGQTPQVIVPRNAWQSAQSLGDESADKWTLVGCTVAPGFEFSGFELAPKDWTPEQ